MQWRQIKRLEHELEEKNKVILHQSRENKDLKASFNSCKEENGKLRLQLKGREGELASKQTLLTNLEGAMNTQRKKLDALERSLDRVESQNCRLKSAVHSGHITQERLKQQAELDAQHFQMEKAEHSKTQSDLKTAEDQLEASLSRHRSYEMQMVKRIAKLEHDVQQIAGELLKEQVENTRLHQEMETLCKSGHQENVEREAGTKGPRSSGVESQLKILRKAVLRYSHQVRTLQASLQDKEQTIQRLHQALGSKRIEGKIKARLRQD